MRVAYGRGVAQVRLERITKTFGSAGAAVRAVDGVSLDVADHEFMILLGPSGCGKSTLLRMIAGLEDPTEGDIFIGDRRVNDVAPKERDVAMVFQSYALYPHKTVRANIEFPLKVRGVPRDQRSVEAKQAADVLGLGELMDRKPGQLSGGQRQRVALARAIVRRPAVFCMDEPLSNLDAKLRGETRAELVDLHRRLESTFVFVTHDQVEAMTMGSRIAVMNAGRLQQVGSPHEVYEHPATSFVAQFIGTPPMNLLPPGVLDRPDVVIGIRPEHVVMTPTGAHLANVRLVEQLGHETLVTCELVGGVAGGSRMIVRLGAEQVPPTIGQDVLLDLPAAHRHRFDAATGERLP
ncbi:MAG: carbohydrate transporter ATP-binding protein family [Ilumatobacteraceae bacterium]|nr:carbohydrate transporter ATP-binding protein family [Ilumatobacteraceae bacterium]